MGKPIELDYTTGETRVTFSPGGKTYKLRPPKLGQMRELDLLAQSIDRDSKAEVEERVAKALADLQEGEELDDVTLATLRNMSPVELAFASAPWWVRLVELCGDGKQPIPDPETDFELWVGSAAVIGRLQAFWMLYPFVALGPLAPDQPMTSPTDSSG